MTDTAIQQTSASLPATTDPMQAPLVNPQPKASFASRTTDAYGTRTSLSDSKGGIGMPPPPPDMHSLSGSSPMPSAPAADNSALIAPPPPAPAGVSSASTLPPLPTGSDKELPPPPPVSAPLPK
jgi:hypothetical protein